MPALRQQIDCRAASHLLSQLRSQLRCDGAAQLAVNVGYPNNLARTIAQHNTQGTLGQSVISGFMPPPA